MLWKEPKKNEKITNTAKRKKWNNEIHLEEYEIYLWKLQLLNLLLGAINIYRCPHK